MKHITFLVLAVICTGCYGETIETGQRGLLLEPRSGGSHEVLSPGYHSTSSRGRVDDFDVTCSTTGDVQNYTKGDGEREAERMKVAFTPPRWL